MPEDLRPANHAFTPARWAAVALLLAGTALTAGAKPGGGGEQRTGSSPAPEAGPGGWVRVDYSDLIDLRKTSHSGEPIGVLLGRLGGRPAPPPGERPADAVAHALLDPLLEPYAFVLADLVDSLTPAPDPPAVEVGDLWRPGAAQPAWAELLRARHVVVESGGEGRLRAFVPWTAVAGGATPASEAAAREAWEGLWPVLRHVVAAEQRRLAGRGPVEAEAYPFVAHPESGAFDLGLAPYRVRVESTALDRSRKPLDAAAVESFLERRLLLEGGRLDPDGTLHLFGSEPAAPPSLASRPIALADVAVAYRAVFRGDGSEPFMSLDRGDSPQTSLVNYGGRLRDTSLGLVSLLNDVRFKTFSTGIDVLGSGDVRERVRREIPEFRTHLERFAADTAAQGVMAQQTRLWFYPDDVDVVLSQQGDVLAIRRARMSAASERVSVSGVGPAAGEDPPWTVETVAAVNRDYDSLARIFPELSDLDQAARWLTLFTWLREVGRAGHPLPDLDALLAVELPPLPTPRRFPQLLTGNILPPAGSSGPVRVTDEASVAAALDRLGPPPGTRIPARRRLSRAVALLDLRLPDHAALAREIESANPSRLDEASLDLLAGRAERLFMHRLVLEGIPDEARKAGSGEPGSRAPRVFSLGIGGVDLGMGQAIARASRREARLSWGGPAPRGGARPVVGIVATRGGSAPAAASVPTVSGKETVDGGEDVARTVRTELPPHGLGGRGKEPAAKEYASHWIRRGDDGSGRSSRPWILTVAGADGPDSRSRRLLLQPDGRALAVERVEDGRFLRFRFERAGAAYRAARLEALPDGFAPAKAAAGEYVPASEREKAAAMPASLCLLDLPALAASSDAANVNLVVRAGGRKDREARMPRAALQRVVLGPDADPLAGRPLAVFSPWSAVLGGTRALMVMQDATLASPPWLGVASVPAGEERATSVAVSLGRWWAREAAPGGDAPPVVVGTDRGRSGARWDRAPNPGKDALLLLPDEGFVGLAAAHRAAVERAWSPAAIASSLPGAGVPSLVVLVSGEPPDLLGARLRSLAREPAMKGKLLAVWSLSGPLRPDLPASLLAEGTLAGIGIAEAAPPGLGLVAARLASFREEIERRSGRSRVEEVEGPFLWVY